MKTRSDSLVRFLAAATLVLAAAFMMTPVAAGVVTKAAAPGAAPLFGGLHSGAPHSEGPAGWQPDPDPQEDMAVAEFGIDPMVTGPVSEEFRQRQAALRCHEARWPNIPAGCYPDLN